MNNRLKYVLFVGLGILCLTGCSTAKKPVTGAKPTTTATPTATATPGEAVATLGTTEKLQILGETPQKVIEQLFAKITAVDMPFITQISTPFNVYPDLDVPYATTLKQLLPKTEYAIKEVVEDGDKATITLECTFMAGETVLAYTFNTWFDSLGGEETISQMSLYDYNETFITALETTVAGDDIKATTDTYVLNCTKTQSDLWELTLDNQDTDDIYYVSTNNVLPYLLQLTSEAQESLDASETVTQDIDTSK